MGTCTCLSNLTVKCRVLEELVPLALMERRVLQVPQGYLVTRDSKEVLEFKVQEEMRVPQDQKDPQGIQDLQDPRVDLEYQVNICVVICHVKEQLQV